MKKKFKCPKGYYGFAHELNSSDKRIKKYAKQRREHGFDDTETWNLDASILKFILPRLKRFKEVTNGHPGNLTEQQWNDVLDTMIQYCEFSLTDELLYIHSYSEKQKKLVKNGRKAFIKYFHHLWW